jgi:hypothetical protein
MTQETADHLDELLTYHKLTPEMMSLATFQQF